jgi:hypothetical protein
VAAHSGKTGSSAHHPPRLGVYSCMVGKDPSLDADWTLHCRGYLTAGPVDEISRVAEPWPPPEAAAIDVNGIIACMDGASMGAIGAECSSLTTSNFGTMTFTMTVIVTHTRMIGTANRRMKCGMAGRWVCSALI